MFGFKLTATAFDQPTPAGAGLAQGDTVARMFWDGVARRGDRVALRQKDFGIWKPLSWNELGDIVREVAMGLVALGYQPGEVASVLSNTNREWIYADLGALSAGGVVNGIYPTDAATQVEYLCADSSTVILFVEDDEQLDKALEVRARLPGLRKIVVFDMEGLRELDDPQVMSFDDLRRIGRAHHAAHPELLRQRIAVDVNRDTLGAGLQRIGRDRRHRRVSRRPGHRHVEARRGDGRRPRGAAGAGRDARLHA